MIIHSTIDIDMSHLPKLVGTVPQALMICFSDLNAEFDNLLSLLSYLCYLFFAAFFSSTIVCS